MNIFQECVDHLVFSMSPKNAAHLLIIGKQRNVEILTTAALDFIAKHMKDFVGAGGVQEVEEYDVRLMKKMLRCYTDSLVAEAASAGGS